MQPLLLVAVCCVAINTLFAGRTHALYETCNFYWGVGSGSFTNTSIVLWSRCVEVLMLLLGGVWRGRPRLAAFHGRALLPHPAPHPAGA